MSDVTKILLIGLDNSGKTSLTLALQKTSNLMSYYSLKPTQGLNVTEFMDGTTEFRIWEFGGQKVYRDGYLNKINKYALDTDKFIFVIDVQDTTRYEVALQYLEDISNTLKEKPSIFCVYLHKFDPGLEKVQKYSMQHLSKVLINRINTIIPAEYKVKIFKTSIYAMFQKDQLQ